MSCLKSSENSDKKSNGPSEPLLKYDDMPSLQNGKEWNLMLTISNLSHLGIMIWKKKIKIEDQSDEIELLKKTDLAMFNKCTKIKRGCDSTKISN